MSDGIVAIELRAYRRAISQLLATGQATEHSYRPALQTLVQALSGDGLRAINEPSHVVCGAPDFIVECRRVPIGHIECKDIGTNLDRIETDEQLTRYRTGLPNLVLTDYLPEFRWYAYGELLETARLGRIDNQRRITTDKGSAKSIAALFDAFFSADPVPSIYSSARTALD